MPPFQFLRSRPTLLAAIAALGCAVLAGEASGSPTLSTHFTTDPALSTHLDGLGVVLPADQVLLAQARGGNNALIGTYEIGLFVSPRFTLGGPVGGGSQQVWGSGGGGNAWVGFSLERVGSTLSFSMANYTGHYTADAVADIGLLSLRLRSDAPGDSTAVRDLMIDGEALADNTLVAADGGLSLAVIDGLVGDFRLSGESAMNWRAGHAIPAASRLGFLIRGIAAPSGGTVRDGEVTSVPEPASAAMLLTGLLALVGMRRRG